MTSYSYQHLTNNYPDDFSWSRHDDYYGDACEAVDGMCEHCENRRDCDEHREQCQCEYCEEESDD